MIASVTIMSYVCMCTTLCLVKMACSIWRTLTSGSGLCLDDGRFEPFPTELMRVGVVSSPRGRGLGVGVDWRSGQVTGLIWSNEWSNKWSKEENWSNDEHINP